MKGLYEESNPERHLPPYDSNMTGVESAWERETKKNEASPGAMEGLKKYVD